MIFINCQLADQSCRARPAPVAPLRPGQESTLDLRGAQGDVTNNRSRYDVANDIGARDTGRMVGPTVAVKPVVQGVSAAIKSAPIVGFGEWTWWRYFCHVGALRARSLSPS